MEFYSFLLILYHYDRQVQICTLKKKKLRGSEVEKSLLKLIFNKCF